MVIITPLILTFFLREKGLLLDTISELLFGRAGDLHQKDSRRMRCLVVKAHPLSESLCSYLTSVAVDSLRAAGHVVEVEDLYGEDFNASLTDAERRSYYAGPYDDDRVRACIERLVAAEAIVLVFPTWWFGFPAILKGWFDRVWAPGAAYDHADGFGPIRPRLTGLRHMLAVTTLGSAWWVDRLVLRQPVKRVLSRAIVGTCAPKCRLQMLSVYGSESLTLARVERFAGRIKKTLGRWPVSPADNARGGVTNESN
jgi:putative NADPH-quinone reductase